MPFRTCPVCEKPFHHYPSEKYVTCSRTCAASYFRDKGTMIDCPTCGKSFYRQKWVADKGNGNYCSKPCWAATRIITVQRICVNCGETFIKDHWSVTRVKNGGKFCCRRCSDTFRRKLRKRGEQEMFTNWQKREWKCPACARCDSTERLELDHILPRFAGGKATKDNAQTLCRTCNRKKFWTDDFPLWESLLLKRQVEAC